MLPLKHNTEELDDTKVMYRTSRVGQLIPMLEIEKDTQQPPLLLPKYLACFNDREVTLLSAKSNNLCSDFTEVQSFDFYDLVEKDLSFSIKRKLDVGKHPSGLTFFSYTKIHTTQFCLENASDLPHGNSFMLLSPGHYQELTLERIKALRRRINCLAAKNKLALKKFYFCYELDSTFMPNDFEIIKGEEGRHCLCVNQESVINGCEIIAFGEDEMPHIYCPELLTCEGWKPHCIQLRIEHEPNPYLPHFDIEIWRGCCVIFEYAGSCLNMEAADILLDGIEMLQKRQYQLLSANIDHELLQNFVEACYAITPYILNAEHFDHVDRLVELIKQTIM